MINPALFPPIGQWLGGIYTKVVEFWVMPLVAKLGLGEPIFRELHFAVGHIFPAKNPHLKQLFWRQGWVERWINVTTHGRDKDIDIVVLHQVIDYNLGSHRKRLRRT